MLMPNEQEASKLASRHSGKQTVSEESPQHFQDSLCTNESKVSESIIVKMMSYGFTREHVENALKQADNDMNVAMSTLLTQEMEETQPASSNQKLNISDTLSTETPTEDRSTGSDVIKASYIANPGYQLRAVVQCSVVSRLGNTRANHLFSMDYSKTEQVLLLANEFGVAMIAFDYNESFQGSLVLVLIAGFMYFILQSVMSSCSTCASQHAQTMC